jgi:HK97 family phage major capsid protein
MAVKEDQCAFVGDGTSTYGGIIGLTYSFQKTLQDAGGTWTNDTHKGYLGSGVVAAGNAFSEVTLQNFIDTKNKVARYPGLNPSWFIHDAAAAATMERLQYALSGNSAPNTVDGLPARFLGYPVVYTNAMPSTEANSQVFCTLRGPLHGVHLLRPSGRRDCHQHAIGDELPHPQRASARNGALRLHRAR